LHSPVSLIQESGINLDLVAESVEDAIRESGRLLEELGAVEAGYTDAMIQRETNFSTNLGMGFALPHGTLESQGLVRFNQVTFLRLREKLHWGDSQVSAVLGIAVSGESHVEFLGHFADLVQDPAKRDVLLEVGGVEEILVLLAPNN
jgi:mannitol PTS system EIIA component